jgi:glucose/arabinose dehydrogenase
VDFTSEPPAAAKPGCASRKTSPPKYVYVANTDSVVRFPYGDGDLHVRGQAETVVNNIPAGGEHWRRDVVFSRDGAKMFVSVGSTSNDAENLKQRTQPEGLGSEERRADVLQYNPDGTGFRIFATVFATASGWQ